MSDTTILRELPRARRTAGRATARFVVPLPSLRALAGPALDELRLTTQAYRALTLGLTAAGALLWPATLAGLVLVAPPTAVFLRLQRTPTPEEITGWFLVAGLGAGGVVGALQWAALRSVALGTLAWIPVTALGWALGVAAMARAVFPISAWVRTIGPSQRFTFWAPEWERYAQLALLGAVIGLVFGTAQWVALRRISLPLPGRSLWFVATALTWTLGFALVPLMPPAPNFVQDAGLFSAGFDITMPGLMLAGAFYGLLTGFALTLMLRSAAPRPIET